MILSSYIFIFTFISLFNQLNTVDHSNFKTCEQSGFCRRHRHIKPGQSNYVAHLDTLSPLTPSSKTVAPNTANAWTVIVEDSLHQVNFVLELYLLADRTVRFRMREQKPYRERFEPPIGDVLIEEPRIASTPAKVDRASDGTKVTFSIPADKGDFSVTLFANPLRIDLFQGGELVLSANARGLLRFEHTRPPGTKIGAPINENQANQVPDPNAAPDPEAPAAGAVGEGENQAADLKFKADAAPDAQAAAAKLADVLPYDEYDLIENGPESFKSHSDSKPYGLTAVGMDFSFINFKHVYGIPEHADSFVLKNTRDGEPYRLFNLDVFEYELSSRMALYGSVPYMLAHNAQRTAGLFWLNPSETWIDIEYETASTLGRLFGGDSNSPSDLVHTHWMSEAGVIDVYVLLGPSPQEVFSQYAHLTGTTQLPPISMLGYHQCRWNYNDEQDVKSVDATMDENDIPYDVLWLDIEYTDGKRYFTWDSTKFPNPTEMLGQLVAKGRRMVTIIDPHIKSDTGFSIYREARDRGFFVKNKDKNDFEGHCWPGASSYLDYIKPAVRQWWAQQYTDNAATKMACITSPHMFTWNDMNEPSVFSGPEITMHPDNLHRSGGPLDLAPYGFLANLGSVFGLGSNTVTEAKPDQNAVEPEKWWEHREVHNLYGMYMHMSSKLGQLMRTDGQERTFILTRSVFAGSQRFGAKWTGDNKADWAHLKITGPMLLSLSVSGVSFVGADVGGFFGNPEAELQVRWYQAGAWHPFFRAHAHIDTRRREPYLLGNDHRALVRQAIRTRQAYLPYFYTLFAENERTGAPPMRPLWAEFPSDPNTFDLEDQFMIGSAILVRPVLENNQNNVEVYLPNEIWYDMNSYRSVVGTGQRVRLDVSLASVPVFQRGGTILSRKERMRRSVALARYDPLTLWVALDAKNSASGTLYIDDYHSNRYKSANEFGFYQFTFKNNMLESRPVDANGVYKTTEIFERIIILGFPKQPQAITVSTASVVGPARSLQFGYMDDRKLLVIRKPELNPLESWTISFS